MRQILVFGAGALALVGAVLALTWPFLGRESWIWLAAAGGVAFVAQIGLHILLTGWRQDPEKFFKAVVTGAGVRLAAVTAGLIWVAVGDVPHPVAFMLGLAGFLFGMLLIESGLENTDRFRPGLAQSDPAVRG